MRGRIGLFVVALAAVALVACENETFAGRRHRGGCSSCGSAGAACATCPAPEAEAAASAAPEAPQPQTAANPADSEPAKQSVVEQPSSRGTYTASRRSMRRGRR